MIATEIGQSVCAAKAGQTLTATAAETALRKLNPEVELSALLGFETFQSFSIIPNIRLRRLK